jgi:hypothetical protein
MSAEHADREAGSIPNIPSTYQWPTAVRVLDLQPGFRIGEFLPAIAIGRQTIWPRLDARRVCGNVPETCRGMAPT